MQTQSIIKLLLYLCWCIRYSLLAFVLDFVVDAVVIVHCDGNDARILLFAIVLFLEKNFRPQVLLLNKDQSIKCIFICNSLFSIILVSKHVVNLIILQCQARSLFWLTFICTQLYLKTQIISLVSSFLKLPVLQTEKKIGIHISLIAKIKMSIRGNFFEPKTF